MFLRFAVGLFVIALGSVAAQLFWRLRILRSRSMSGSGPLISADRYRPMLRLLADDDLEFIGANRKLRRTLRTQRRRLFRSYLRCMASDYGLLLAGIRLVMVQSGVDRPDLSRALAKNRFYFALALCKIEIRLAMHAAGVGRVDVSGLLEALETLRSQALALSPAPSA